MINLALQQHFGRVHNRFAAGEHAVDSVSGVIPKRESDCAAFPVASAKRMLVELPILLGSAAKKINLDWRKHRLREHKAVALVFAQRAFVKRAVCHVLRIEGDTIIGFLSPRESYAVIGAGVFGAWTAYYLLAAGHKVTLLDQYGPASSRASSGGETRIIRCSYGPEEVYSSMAKRSLPLWENFFGKREANLLRRIGVLWMAKPDNEYALQSRATLGKLGIPFQELTAAELKRQYPQIRPEPGTVAIFEPDSGALMARQAVAAVVNRFQAQGGTYRQAAIATPRAKEVLRAITTSSGESITVDAYVFACGAWLAKMFPEVLADRIFPTRQEVLFFGIPPGDLRFSPPAMPVWLDFSDGRRMYGFPDLEARGFKVAFDLHGPPIDPDIAGHFVRPEKIAAAREYMRERFPVLAHAPVVDSRVCQYENTSNGDFLIDRHPELENVWFVGGGSGHGFKHGPAVGEYAAARVTGARYPPVQPRFSLASKGTKQDRVVY